MFGLMRSLAVMLVVAVALVSAAAPQEKAPRVAAPGPARLEQLVDANIVGVHAYQILLARKQSNVDPVCWSARDKKGRGPGGIGCAPSITAEFVRNGQSVGVGGTRHF
jgi:hypothetical protein